MFNSFFSHSTTSIFFPLFLHFTIRARILVLLFHWHLCRNLWLKSSHCFSLFYNICTIVCCCLHCTSHKFSIHILSFLLSSHSRVQFNATFPNIFHRKYVSLEQWRNVQALKEFCTLRNGGKKSSAITGGLNFSIQTHHWDEVL